MIQTKTLKEFARGQEVQVKSTIGTISSDSEVVQRWNDLVDTWNEHANNPDVLKQFPYDATGRNGYNCESVAEWILTGITRTHQGFWLGILQDIGIVDPGGGFSSRC